MRNFTDLGINIDRRFAGQRIGINAILGREIVVHDIDIRESKLKKDGEDKQCVYVDLEVDGERRLMWGSYGLMIKQAEVITSDLFPFRCKIINDHGYMFV